MKKYKETKLSLDLFRMGWFCAQDVVANVYQNHFSEILKYITRLSFLGTVFKPDQYTASLNREGEVLCKTKYDMKVLGSALVPKWTISTDYSYIGAKTFQSTVKLILTPSISVFLGQNENERSVITGDLETAYTLKYDGFICKGKASYQATTRYGFEDALYTILPRDNNYEYIKSFFTRNLRNSIIDVSCELDNSFTELNKELQKKEVPICQSKEAQVNLTTLLKILARDNIFAEAIVRK